MPDALVPVDVDALDLLTFDQRVDAIGKHTADGGVSRLRRRGLSGARYGSSAATTARAAATGAPFSTVSGLNGHGRIRYMRLAEGFSDALQIATYRTVDAALKALGPKRLASVEPAVEHPVEHPVEEEHPAVEEHPDTVIEAVAVEAEPTAADLRDERLERLAIVTEDVDGNVVDHWAAKHAEADERHRRDAQRHREDVATINAERRATAAERRKLRDVCDALLAVPGCKGCGDVLRKFYSVQRKAPAA